MYRIDGLATISETNAGQQYVRTGALPFWVAGILMNQWVRQLDHEKLLKDALASVWVTGHFAAGWLQNLDFGQLPNDLVQYYQTPPACPRPGGVNYSTQNP